MGITCVAFGAVERKENGTKQVLSGGLTGTLPQHVPDSSLILVHRWFHFHIILCNETRLFKTLELFFLLITLKFSCI